MANFICNCFVFVNIYDFITRYEKVDHILKLNTIFRGGKKNLNK